MAKKNELETTIKLLIKRNLLEVIEIEKISNYEYDPDFGNLESSNAWNSEKFIAFIRKKNTLAYTIMFLNKVVGFLLIENFESHTVIERLTVHIKHRRNGFGTSLLNFLIEKNFNSKIIFYSRENDKESLMFFSKKKFKSKLEKKYFSSDIDAIKFSMESGDDKKKI